MNGTKQAPGRKSSPISLLIVDDEPAARDILREMLTREVEAENVAIVGECENGRQALIMIKELRPDVVFLDIQMPEMDGFKVLSALSPEQLPIVIFVTAFDQFAVRAFEIHALDYLLKPFDRERFEMAFTRVKRMVALKTGNDFSQRILQMLDERGQSAASAQATPFLERLAIKADGRVFFLRTEEIEWISAEGNYVALHVGSKAHLYREPISTLETQLDRRRFRRIHRSTIVNVDYIKELQSMFRGEYHVIMQDGTELKLSHNYREDLQRELGVNF